MVANNNILILIILVNTAIGFLIKFSNPGRSQNKHFFYLSLVLTAWMLCVFSIMNAQTAKSASILIRTATIAAATLPFQMGMLLQSIRHPAWSTFRLLKEHKALGLTGILVTIICLSPFFMDGVIMPSATHPKVKVPDAQYDIGFFLFAGYFLFSLIYTMIVAVRASMTSTGLMKVELQYVLLGGGVMLVSGSFISVILPWLTQTTQVQQYGPLSVILMNFIIAYGIATRKILDVGTVIRKLVAYVLLTVYLVIIYMVTWQLSKFVLFSILPNPSLPAHILSALAIAFSMSPAHGRLQAFANKMISTQAVDVPLLIKQAGAIFQSVTTYDALVQQFSDLLEIEMGSNEVKIFLPEGSRYKRYQLQHNAEDNTEISADAAMVSLLQETREAVSHDNLVRARQTVKTKQALNELYDLKADLAVGFFLKTGKSGIVLMEPRRGGRIYDKAEQDALQILCNQFAVALENAEMYTEMQDSKIRNEIMLDQLVSGVILANTERKITLLNHEAQRITGILEEDAIGQDIDILPKPIARALDGALQREQGERNIDARLFEQDESKKSYSIRVGTTFLIGHDGKPMGALLVFTDMTELKSLEEQVRRSDQLSSVGTLAAGMAHEIKNPLVTIKTFTQLLPQRYSDEDFRKDFSALVAHEVARIDGIVNELLSFSKPTKPHLVPMNFHETMEQILKLTHEQMVQKNIKADNAFQAETDIIQGDAKLLSQALINLTLNAIEAIGKNGTITIATSNCDYRFANGQGPTNAISKKCIRIQISDTGQGIPRDNIQKIFDPFFTSKSEGTGMGLSVAHGIINEHHGVMEVESEPGTGTTFLVYLPVLEEVVA